MAPSHMRNPRVAGGRPALSVQSESTPLWRLPQDEIRNCWFEMPMAPGESESSLAYRIRTMAEMVISTSQALLQWDPQM